MFPFSALSLHCLGFLVLHCPNTHARHVYPCVPQTLHVFQGTCNDKLGSPQCHFLLPAGVLVIVLYHYSHFGLGGLVADNGHDKESRVENA
ncbi:hypothetical protein J3F84DRAFT_366522 [Trichoderma pleuroticola]